MEPKSVLLIKIIVPNIGLRTYQKLKKRIEYKVNYLLPVFL